MAKNVLGDMNDDFDDDSMDDILGHDLENSSSETGTAYQTSSKKKKFSKLKKGFKLRLGSKKAILISGIFFILLIGILLAAWLFFFKGNADKGQGVQDTMTVEKKIQTTASREDKVVFEDVLDLEPFERIQLKPGSTMGLISMNLSLELTDYRLKKQVHAVEDRIRKIITGQVEQMTWLELRSPEGKIMLKYNLLQQINSIFPKATVRNIYFTTFIMQ